MLTCRLSVAHLGNTCSAATRFTFAQCLDIILHFLLYSHPGADVPDQCSKCCMGSGTLLERRYRRPSFRIISRCVVAVQTTVGTLVAKTLTSSTSNP